MKHSTQQQQLQVMQWKTEKLQYKKMEGQEGPVETVTAGSAAAVQPVFAVLVSPEMKFNQY